MTESPLPADIRLEVDERKCVPPAVFVAGFAVLALVLFATVAGVVQHFWGDQQTVTASGPHPLASSSSRHHDPVVACSQLQPCRHAGETFKLQVFNVSGEMVAQFDVRDPNPNHAAYPNWQPESLPVTKTDGDVSVTLTALTASGYERSIRSRKIPSLHVNPIVQVTQNGKPTAAWSTHNFRFEDAVGNLSSRYDCRLSKALGSCT